MAQRIRSVGILAAATVVIAVLGILWYLNYVECSARKRMIRENVEITITPSDDPSILAADIRWTNWRAERGNANLEIYPESPSSGQTQSNRGDPDLKFRIRAFAVDPHGMKYDCVLVQTDPEGWYVMNDPFGASREVIPLMVLPAAATRLEVVPSSARAAGAEAHLIGRITGEYDGELWEGADWRSAIVSIVSLGGIVGTMVLAILGLLKKSAATTG